MTCSLFLSKHLDHLSCNGPKYAFNVSVGYLIHSNGLVARAMERAVVQALGLDPTGVAVPEAGHVSGGGPAYLGSLAAYARGDAAGVGLWLTQAGEAYVRGAAEGERISDAVRAGRLT